MRLLADAILLLHFGVILVVLLTPVLVLCSTRVRDARGWRVLHLLLTALVAAQAVLGIECPLTTWENALRIGAGQAGYGSQGFIADWLHRLIFFQAEPWVFTTLYGAWLAVVLLGWWWQPPRRGPAASKA